MPGSLLRDALGLQGFLEIAGRKYRRALAVARGGQPGLGLVLLRYSGKSPGGFPTQQMQVSKYDLATWCLEVLKWLRQVKYWEEFVTEEQMKVAKQVVADLKE